jgi:hypothetical protein
LLWETGLLVTVVIQLRHCRRFLFVNRGALHLSILTEPKFDR